MCRSLLVTGLTLGVGLIGTLDGAVLHQLLQWHNLYVHTTLFWRTFVDGLFHLLTGARDRGQEAEGTRHVTTPRGAPPSDLLPGARTRDGRVAAVPSAAVR